MKTWPINTQRFSGIAECLYENYEKVKGLYPYDGLDPEAADRRIPWLDTHPGAERETVAAALEALNRRLGAGEETLAQVEALRDPRSLVVVTGQQSGLFTGPLYTLYKAATVLKRARALNARTGRPVVPVFWMATEDHDYAEIAMNWHFDGARVKPVRLGRAHKGNRPVGQLPTSQALQTLTEDLAGTLEGTPFGGETARLLQETLKASETLGDWFGRLLLTLFAPWGLVVLDPAQPSLRRVMQPFFETALQETLTLRQAFDAGTEALEALGFEAEVTLAPGQTGLFLIEEGQRLPLYQAPEAESFIDRDGERHWTLAALKERLTLEPEAFSTGVVLRPVLQDWLLPVAEAVLGPSEAAYHGQLKSVFEALGRQLPVIIPRESWVLAPGQVTLDPGLITGDPEAWVSDRLMDDAAPALRIRLAEQRERQALALRETLGELPLGEGSRQALAERLEQLQTLEYRTLLRHIRRALLAEAPEKRRWQRLARMIRPGGKVQERRLLPWYFYSCFGPELLRTLVESDFSTALRGCGGRDTQ